MPPRSGAQQRPSGAPSAMTKSFPQAAAVQKAALAWFAEHRRALPWRVSKGRPDPYGVWVSEIMAQQTQIATMVPYWTKWMKLFPSVVELAKASEEAVRGAWAGLGYYRRAANLRKGAIYVVDAHKGEVPRTSKELCDVPGIGPYTAGAIASICFGEAVPAVDGNVIRVLSRLLAQPNVDPKTPAATKWAREAAQRLIVGCADPGSFNEALMEIGATVCKPSGPPNCAACPFARFCQAKELLAGQVISAIEGNFPVRAKLTGKSTCRCSCAIHCTVDSGGKWQALLVQRPKDGLLGGMYDFPTVMNDTLLAEPEEDAVVKKGSAKAKANNDEPSKKLQEAAAAHFVQGMTKKKSQKKVASDPVPSPGYVGTVRHVFSHIDMYLSCFVVEWPSAAALERASTALGDLGLLAHSASVKEKKVACDDSSDGEEEGKVRPMKKARAEHSSPTVGKIVPRDELDTVPVSRLVHKALGLAGLPTR